MRYADIYKPETTKLDGHDLYKVEFKVGLVFFKFLLGMADAEGIANLVRITEQGSYMFELEGEEGWCGIVSKDRMGLSLQINSVGSVTLRGDASRVIVESILEAHDRAVANMVG